MSHVPSYKPEDRFRHRYRRVPGLQELQFCLSKHSGSEEHRGSLPFSDGMDALYPQGWEAGSWDPFIGLETETGRDKRDMLLSDSYPELYGHNITD